MYWKILTLVLVMATAISAMVMGIETKVKDVVAMTGTVTYLPFEGGFYGIVGDDGKHYDPQNLSPEFQVQGLRVYFKAKILRDVCSFHMWGQIVSILKIQRLH